jgi:hypothetical protein
MSTDFYEYLHGGQQSQRASRDLPITPQRQPQQAQQMFNSAMSNIEQVKRQLCEKIDVCCAQYGLYGLKVIDKAIAESLRAMINGVAQPMPQQPMLQQQMPIQYPQVNENIYGGYAPRPQMMPPQQPMTREEALTDSFMNNLDTILSECDKDVDKRAEEQMKQRLYEQKQADMMIAQNVDSARQNANIDLAAHENDFTLESEEDLREYV